MVKDLVSTLEERRNKTNKKNQGIVLCKPRTTHGGAVPAVSSEGAGCAREQQPPGEPLVDTVRGRERTQIEQYATAIAELRLILADAKNVAKRSSSQSPNTEGAA